MKKRANGSVIVCISIFGRNDGLSVILSYPKKPHLLSEHLYFIPDDVDASLVGSVQLQDGIFEGGAQQRAGETEDGGGLAGAGRAGDDEIRHVPLLGEDFQATDGLLVAHDFAQFMRTIFFHPR